MYSIEVSEKICYLWRVSLYQCKIILPFLWECDCVKKQLHTLRNKFSQANQYIGGLKKVHHRQLWLLVRYGGKASAHIQSEVHRGPWMDYLLCNFNAPPPALKFSKFQFCVTNWRRVWNRKTAVYLPKRSFPWFLWFYDLFSRKWGESLVSSSLKSFRAQRSFYCLFLRILQNGHDMYLSAK